MKFLFLYKYDQAYSFDGYFHLDLVKHYTQAGHLSMCYGPNTHQAYADVMVASYDTQTTMTQLHEKFAFDAVVLLTKSRMFENYRPPLVPPEGKEIRQGCWLPYDFNEWKGIKIMIDEDTHYETSNEWYKFVGIDIVFNRHKKNDIRFRERGDFGVKSFWLPMSVDPDLFKSDGRKRTNKLCMAASVVHEIYVWRKMLMEKLVPFGLMENFAEQRKVGQGYLDCLKSYVGHGSCSSIYDITPAKMFEIMASGSVLYTDNTDQYGLKELFDDGSYVTYERDGSDIVKNARKIINNPEWAANVAEAGRQCIIKRHTHEIRIKEMVDIVRREL